MNYPTLPASPKERAAAAPAAAHGTRWNDPETLQLLKAIQKGWTIERIAAQHGRTAGAIKCRLKRLAVEYYFNDKRPIEQIHRFTGLKHTTIIRAIGTAVAYCHNTQQRRAMVVSIFEISGGRY